MEKVAAKKNDSLQVYRGLLCLNVFFAHAIDEIKPVVDSNAFGLFPFLKIFALPFLSVTPFFVMSGFLLMQKKDSLDTSISFKECCHSMWKRISRLYPLHIATALFCFFLWGVRYFHGGTVVEEMPRLVRNLVLNVFLIQSWVMIENVPNSLNGTAWYLSVVAFLYFVFPIVRKMLVRLSKKQRALLCLIVILLRILWTGAMEKISDVLDWEYLKVWSCYFFPPFRLSEFLIGCLAGQFYSENKDKLCFSNLRACVAQVATIVFGLLFFSIGTQKFHFWIRMFFDSSVVCVFLSVLWVFLFMEGRCILRFLKIRPLVAFGNISGLFFLIHWPVIEFQRAVRSFFGVDIENLSELKAWGLFFSELILSIVIAVLWKFFSEKLRKKNSQ